MKIVPANLNQRLGNPVARSRSQRPPARAWLTQCQSPLRFIVRLTDRSFPDLAVSKGARSEVANGVA